MYSDVEAARNAVADAEKALADARGYLNRIEREEAERYPLEPQTTDVIVFWVRKMGKNYKFAAVKTEQGWFSTGTTLGFERKTWKGVVDWMREQGVTEFYPLQLAQYADRVSLSR